MAGQQPRDEGRARGRRAWLIACAVSASCGASAAALHAAYQNFAVPRLGWSSQGTAETVLFEVHAAAAVIGAVAAILRLHPASAGRLRLVLRAILASLVTYAVAYAAAWAILAAFGLRIR